MEKISRKVYHAVAPKSKKTLISVNKRFCDVVKQLNSKQLRQLKERLFTINIVLDWDGVSPQDNQPVIPKWERKDDNKRLAQLKGKINFVLLLFYPTVSYPAPNWRTSTFEKRLRVSEGRTAVFLPYDEA